MQRSGKLGGFPVPNTSSESNWGLDCLYTIRNNSTLNNKLLFQKFFCMFYTKKKNNNNKKLVLSLFLTDKLYIIAGNIEI